MHNYSRNVLWSDEDECYIATSPEFQWVSAFGDTPDEAFRELDVALKAAIETYKEKGWELPQPKKIEEYSGQFRVRLPKSLHRQMVERAKAEDVSLNTLVVSYVSAGLVESKNKHERKTTVSIHFRDNMAQIAGAARLLAAPASFYIDSEHYTVHSVKKISDKSNVKVLSVG